MKKTLFILFTFSTVIVAKSQNWVDLGILGYSGPSIMINKNYFDDSEFNQRIAWSYGVGGRVGLNFGDVSELTFDVFYGVNKFAFNYNTFDSITNSSPLYKKELTVITTDLLLLYRIHSSNGSYFEFGPQLSLVSGATEKDDNPNSVQGDVTPYFVDNYTSVDFGFGQYIAGTDNFSILLGARFSYTLMDAISPNNSPLNYPNTGHVYSDYKTSHPLDAVLMLELNYDLGYLVKASCTKRTKIIFF